MIRAVDERAENAPAQPVAMASACRRPRRFCGMAFRILVPPCPSSGCTHMFCTTMKPRPLLCLFAILAFLGPLLAPGVVGAIAFVSMTPATAMTSMAGCPQHEEGTPGCQKDCPNMAGCLANTCLENLTDATGSVHRTVIGGTIAPVDDAFRDRLESGPPEPPPRA
jgi:hypothetical protein